jgi:hypothetical protein
MAAAAATSSAATTQSRLMACALPFGCAASLTRTRGFWSGGKRIWSSNLRS